MTFSLLIAVLTLNGAPKDAQAIIGTGTVAECVKAASKLADEFVDGLPTSAKVYLTCAKIDGSDGVLAAVKSGNVAEPKSSKGPTTDL